MSRKRLVKLVRDRVGQFGNDNVVYEPLTTEDHAGLLRQKLLEEVGEYLLDPSVGELADVLEVVYALAHIDLKVDPKEVASEAAAKYDERGGFDIGTGMYVFSTATERHEGSHATTQHTGDKNR